MNKLRFFLSASLSVICALLLTNERREVIFVPVRPVRLIIYNERFFSNFSVQHFDLTKEPDVRSFRSELQNVHQDRIEELYENLVCLLLGEIEVFANQTELKIGGELVNELVAYLNQTVYAHLIKHPMHFVNSFSFANSPSLIGPAGTLSSRQRIVMNSKLLNKQRALHLKLFDLTILESIRSKRFYILRNKLCIVQSDPSFFSRILSEIFPHSKEYVLLKGAFRLFRLRAGESFDLHVISNQENPNLDCSAGKYANEFEIGPVTGSETGPSTGSATGPVIESDRESTSKPSAMFANSNSMSKFRCLNECFKEKQKLSDYFYSGEESVTIQLTGSADNRSDEASGRPATEHEESCFKRCAKSDCIHVNLKRKPFDNSIEITMVKAQPIISRFYYCLLLIGLIMALFKTSCYKLLTQLAEFTSKRISAKRRSLKPLASETEESNLLPFRIATFLGCFLVFLILANKIISDHIERRDNQSPRLAVTYLSKPEAISLVICVPVDKILHDLNSLNVNPNLNGSGGFNNVNSSHSSYYNRNSNSNSTSDSNNSSDYNNSPSDFNNPNNSMPFSSDEVFDPLNLSMASLEALTRGTFNATIDEIYLEFLGTRYPVFWRWLPGQVLFHNVDHKLSRCERVYVKAEDPKFRSFLAASKLVTTYKHSAFALFLIPGNRKFHSKSYRYDRASKFVKAIHRNEQCTNYWKKFRGECDSQAHCWESCIHNETVGRGRNISADFVIDKSTFSQEKWNSLFVDTFYDKNDEVSRTILGRCNEKFPKPECTTVQFQTFGKFRVHPGRDEHLVKFSLYYDVFNFVGEPSRHRLWLELGNAANLLYDLNFLQLVTFVFLRLRIDLRANRLCSLPFVLLSLVGFVYHLLFILEGIQSGQLLYSQYGEEPNVVEMPELFLCFDKINSSSIHEIPENYSLTGNYLEGLTTDTRVDTVFRQVSYLNGRGEWKAVNFSEGTFSSNQEKLMNSSYSSEYSNHSEFDRTKADDNENKFSIEPVYFFGKKCFKIRHQIDYRIGQFYFFDEFADRTQPVLKIDFNRSFVSSNPVTFFTKPRDKLQDLSALVRLNYSRPNRSHLVKQHPTAMTYENKFNVIKNFLSVSGDLLSDADEYLSKMRRRFAKEQKSNPIILLKNALSIFPTNHLDDVDMYLSRLRNNFRRDRNATTLHLLLERGDFDLPINDSAFQEYYERVQRPKDRHSSDSLLYSRRTPINLLRELPKGRMRANDRRSDNTMKTTDLRSNGSDTMNNKTGRHEDKAEPLADFIFHLMFYRENEVIRGNEESWSRLVLNLLNLFAVWMNLKSFRRLPLSSRIAKLKKRFKRRFKSKEDQQTIRKTLHTTLSRSMPELGEITAKEKRSLILSFRAADHLVESRPPVEVLEPIEEEDYDEIRKEMNSIERSISRLDVDHF